MLVLNYYMYNEKNKHKILTKEYVANVYGNEKNINISVNMDKFIPNASSIIYASHESTIIAWSKIDDFEIVFEVVGDVRMYDVNTNQYYYNEVPDYAKEILITEENIESYGYNVDESNCFEIRYLRKNEDGTYEYYGGSDEIFVQLDGTPEQLMDLLYTETITFLQENL